MIRNSDMTPSRASPHKPAQYENFPKTAGFEVGGFAENSTRDFKRDILKEIF